jgi:uncharacterized protein (TIGR02284 family)
MENQDETVSVLNDLIEINNDRIVGYERAIKETGAESIDLKGIFNEMADQSRKYASELKQEVPRLVRYTGYGWI